MDAVVALCRSLEPESEGRISPLEREREWEDERERKP